MITILIIAAVFIMSLAASDMLGKVGERKGEGSSTDDDDYLDDDSHDNTEDILPVIPTGGAVLEVLELELEED